MNISECINFLGHASVYPQFDLFLLNDKIKKRLKGKESYETLSSLDNKVVLSFQLFDDFSDESLIPAKSKGKSILSEIEVHSGYSGHLPYDLSFNDTIEGVKNKLGGIIEEIELPNRHIFTFYYDLLLIGVFISDNEGIYMIKISVPTVYDKKNLGIEV